MDIAQVVEIALANSDDRRIEITTLEPATISMEVVGGLSQLISEFVHNALAFSDPDHLVRLSGLHDQDGYLVSIADRGVGIPEDLVAELNRVLADPGAWSGSEPSLGIDLAARLASRHGIAVRLVPGALGTTARVTIPPGLVGDQVVERARVGDTELAQPDDMMRTVDVGAFEHRYRIGSGIVAMSDEARREAEEFLEKVFSPLVDSSSTGAHSGEIDNGTPEPEIAVPPLTSVPEPRATVTELRVRVPGENFSLTEDEPSTVAAERAIDIRSALSSYQRGRRSASEQRDA